MFDVSKYEELFSTESREYISSLNRDLLRLEKEKDPGALGEIFRSLHTLKGMAGSLGYGLIVDVTHRMEDIVEKLREGDLSLEQPVIDLLFEAVDLLETLVEERERVERRGVDELLGRIDRLSAEGVASLPPTPARETAFRRTSDVRISLRSLERLGELVAELVVTRENLTQIASRYRLEGLKDRVSHLARSTSDLEDEIQKLTTIPLSRAFERFPRFVRNSAREQGKEVEFVMEGQEVELDRLMVDRLTEPLFHLLRNAVSHGIEHADERLKLGKGRTGMVKLKAERLKDFIAVSVSDDGRGVDTESVLETAISKGIIRAEESSMLSREDLLELVARAGVSTSREVTAVSGRGVGLDVVREAVRGLGGSLVIESEPGAGAAFTLKFPLTLAVVRVLLVTVGDGVYCIPLTHVVETLKVESSRLKTIQNKEVLVLRGEVLPVLRVGEVLGIQDGRPTTSPISVVVCQADSRRAGLVVDNLLGQTEAALKSLDQILSGIEEYAGVTVLGDGRPSLILDVAGIV